MAEPVVNTLASAAEGLPAAFVARLQRELPGQATAILTALAPRARVGLRLNPLVAPPEDTMAVLRDQFGADLLPIAGLPLGASVPQVVRATLVDHEVVRSGAAQLQNPSSQLPVLALDPQLGEEVLDLAAAPGGKTLHMAALLAGSGRLAAVEAVKPRFHRLREVLRAGGAGAVHCYLMDGRQVGRKTPMRFDRVLLDAPCSSEARFDAMDPKSWAHWSAHKEAECVRKQRGLLAAAFAALRPGGTLVYSTCSYSAAENEGVVDWLLRRVGDEAELMPWACPATCATRAGVTQLGSRALDTRLGRAVRVLPDGLFEGFFLAVLRRRTRS